MNENVLKPEQKALQGRQDMQSRDKGKHEELNRNRSKVKKDTKH